MIPVLENTTTDTGRIGENLVAYILERSGVYCHLVDRRGSDIWCHVPDVPAEGRDSEGEARSSGMFRVEVKTATAPSHEGRGHFTYSYQVVNRTADWFAFVALDRELVFFMPRSGLKSYTTHRFGQHAFHPRHQTQTLEQMVRVNRKDAA